MGSPPLSTVDLSRYVNEETEDRRPHVRGRRVPVATLAHSAITHGWTVAELAYQFGLSEAQVAAALLYYEEHKESIEAQEAAYQQALDSAYDKANRA